MKRFLSLFLIAALIFCPCMAQADEAESEQSFGLYTLEEARISVEIPEDWYVLTREQGAESGLAQAFGLDQESVDEILLSSDMHLYAMTDELASGVLVIISTNGLDEPDMRNPDSIADPDSFLNGYLLGSDGDSVLEAGLYDAGSCRYVRIFSVADDEYGESYDLQYAANAAGRSYFIRYFTSYGIEIDEETEQLIDSIVDSICFLDNAPVYQDETLICVDCGEGFIFSAEYQQMYDELGFQNKPARCPECREARRNATPSPSATNRVTMYDILCDGCGAPTQVPFQPRGDRPVYCSDCYNAMRQK